MVSLDVCKWGVKNGFWKICLRHNIVDLCDKQDSLMCDTAAFVCSMRRTTLACYKLYWTVQMLMTCDDPAVIDAKARESQFFHTRPHSMTPLTLIVLSRLDRGIQSVGTNLIHDFTAVTFSVKLAFFREKRPFPCFHEIPWNLCFFVNFNTFTFIYEGFQSFINSFCADFAVLLRVTLQH